MRSRGTCALAAVLMAAVLFALAGCHALETAGGPFAATRTESASFPASGIPVIEVTASNGTVTVHGVAGQTDVRVVATLQSRGTSQSEANEHVSAVAVHMEQQGSRVIVAYRAAEQTASLRSYSGASFDVTTPAVADVVAQTNNGSMTVSGLRGRLDLTTSNGEVTIQSVVGEVKATTSNGRISLARCQGVLTLATSNGEVVMDDVSAAFDAKTSNGHIGFSGTVVGDANSLSTTNGRIDVAVSAAAAVEFHATTTAGSITSTLPLVGDTQGKEWLATLNPPATAKLSLQTTNGGISIAARP